METSREHSVLAFYGFDQSAVTLEAFFHQAIRWFEEFELKPSLLGIDSKGLSNFAPKAKRLKARGFAHAEYIEIHGFSQDHRSDYPFVALCDPAHFSAHVDFSASVLSFGSESLRRIAETCIQLFKPQYGMGYRRLVNLGPGYYAMGISHGDTSFEEKLRISQSMTAVEGKLYLKGWLRDMYPWNFLTAPQLGVSVNNATTLMAWIQQDGHRGKLRPLSDEVQLWEIPEQDIPGVHCILFDAGVVFDYERDVYAKMREYRLSHKAVVDHLREGRPFVMGPPLPGLKPEQVLGQVLNAMGYTPEETRVLQVEKPGQTREVSTDEVKAIQRKGKKPPKKN
jgi:hypothetical protein